MRTTQTPTIAMNTKTAPVGSVSVSANDKLARGEKKAMGQKSASKRVPDCAFKG